MKNLKIKLLRHDTQRGRSKKLDEKIEKVETLTPYQAGKIIGKNAEYIRAGLRQGRFDFGSAVPPEKPGGNWNYNIIKNKFLEYAGIKERVNRNEKC